MVKIDTIEYFRVPPRWLFVKITDVDGNSGWGEATLEGHTEAVEGSLEELKNRIGDFDADEIENVWQSVYRGGFYRGGPVLQSALSGIDIALWDLKGTPFDPRKLNVPIYELLGGKVRSHLSVYAWIGGDRPSDITTMGQARLAQGYTTVKMNATEDLAWLSSPSALDACIERVRAVKALGLDVGLDFHGRVHLPMARQLARKLEPLAPLFLEEPLLSEHPEAIAALHAQTPLPIALGERLHSRWAVKPFLTAGAVDILQPDVAHIGGISELVRIARMAEAWDVALAPHCPIGPIALAACCQVDAAVANFVYQEMSLGIHYNTDGWDLLTYIKDKETFKVEAGKVKVSAKPGLGIEVDEEVVRKAAAGAKPWRTFGWRAKENGEFREW